MISLPDCLPKAVPYRPAWPKLCEQFRVLAADTVVPPPVQDQKKKGRDQEDDARKAATHVIAFKLPASCPWCNTCIQTLVAVKASSVDESTSAQSCGVCLHPASWHVLASSPVAVGAIATKVAVAAVHAPSLCHSLCMQSLCNQLAGIQYLCIQSPCMQFPCTHYVGIPTAGI